MDFVSWYKPNLLHDVIITKIETNGSNIKFLIDSKPGFKVKNVKSIVFHDASIDNASEHLRDLWWVGDRLEGMVLQIKVHDFANCLENDFLSIQFGSAEIEFEK